MPQAIPRCSPRCSGRAGVCTLVPANCPLFASTVRNLHRRQLSARWHKARERRALGDRRYRQSGTSGESGKTSPTGFEPFLAKPLAPEAKGPIAQLRDTVSTYVDRCWPRCYQWCSVGDLVQPNGRHALETRLRTCGVRWQGETPGKNTLLVFSASVPELSHKPQDSQELVSTHLQTDIRDTRTVVLSRNAAILT